jgi:hypothetical protein
MNRQEAEELLPWFVAGTLNAEEMQAVKAFVDSGELAAEDIAELAFLSESTAATGPDEPAYDPQILPRAMAQLDSVAQAGSSRFLDRLAEPDSGSDPDSRPKTAPTGMLAGLVERLQWALTPPVARIAIAAQFVLVLGLVVALSLGGPNSDELENAGYQVVAGEVVGDFTVSFSPSATEQQIRDLLRDHQASIVAGPSALGIYTLEVADGATEAEVLAAFQASGLTTFMQPVPES